MTFDFHPDAQQEYEDSGHWYERQRHHLGTEFFDAVETGVSLILENPERYRLVGQDLRIFRLKRFPFHIFYRYYPDRSHVRIVAIAHFKRRPEYWRERVSEPGG